MCVCGGGGGGRGGEGEGGRGGGGEGGGGWQDHFFLREIQRHAPQGILTNSYSDQYFFGPRIGTVGWVGGLVPKHPSSAGLELKKLITLMWPSVYVLISSDLPNVMPHGLKLPHQLSPSSLPFIYLSCAAVQNRCGRA